VWYKGDEVFCGVAPPMSSGGSTQKIIFARHGESTGNRDHVAQGQDDPLTTKGIEHAEGLRDALKNRSIRKIISSRSVRALDTAKIVAQYFGLEVEIWDELNGYEFGAIAGTPEVKGKMNIERALEAKQGETLDQYYARNRKACEKIASLHSSGDILIVSHRTNLSTIDVIRSGGGIDDVLGARRKNEDAEHGIWGEISLSESDSQNWEQDQDTLDTWFSSAMWTWSTLVDPKLTEDSSLSLDAILKRSPDFQKFHPTSVLETGYDILFFWVARMILMTTYATGQIPFKTVYLHGLIRTRDGRKMSKSDPSTMIDPLDMITKYGADALRLSMIVGQSPGNDSKLYEEKIAGYRNFVNKLWNASRFVLMKCEERGVNPQDVAVGFNKMGYLGFNDMALWAGLNALIYDVTEGLNDYRLSETGEKLYSFIWNFFCDWYIELSKGEVLNIEVLVQSLRSILILLHPYCPFVTEEIWSHVAYDDELLVKQKWPSAEIHQPFQDAFNDFQILIDVVSAIRSVRNESTIDARKEIDVVLVTKDKEEMLKTQEEHIRRLGKVAQLTIQTVAYKGDDAASAFTKHVEIHVLLGGIIDVAKEKERLTKEKEQLIKFLAGVQAKLNNADFVKNAPVKVLEQERGKEEEAVEKLKKIGEKLAALR